jgi:ribonuclease Z
MTKLIILGSSNAVASSEHDNSHMVIIGSERKVLIDSASSPVLRLHRAGVGIHDLTDVVATHFHPDHVSGIPLLLLNLWMMGRSEPLDVHGLAPTLDRLEALMEFYGWKQWPGFFPVSFHRLAAEELTKVVDCADFRLLASPVHHVIPTIGLRLEVKKSGRVLAYSCDTEPCPQVVRLAAGVDVLIHEASGAGLGHSSAEQAGEQAREAEAGRLVLIHYPTGEFAEPDLAKQASHQYQGEVVLAEDFMTIELG